MTLIARQMLLNILPDGEEHSVRLYTFSYIINLCF
jgi:hypothetical protein